MNCSEVLELLSAYSDGELAGDQRSRMSTHLDECSACAKELAGFENLSAMAGALSAPLPPEHIWSQLEEQLEHPPRGKELPATPVVQQRSWSFSAPKLLALAATVLVVVGIGSLAYQSWFAHGDHNHNEFTADFGQYLDEFRRDPAAAQKLLLTKYENRLVDLDQTSEQVRYRPAVADGMPEGYTLESTRVLKMPCCTCVQTICKRSDGSTLAIFEHDDEETTEWFGDRPNMTAKCCDRKCCFVDLDDQIAANWKRGSRHITLIGVRDVDEVSQMIAWLDKKKLPVPN